MVKKGYDKKTLVSFFLRVGLTVAFFYAAIASLFFPENWIGFFPGFLKKSWILLLFSAYELILGFWLLSNKKIFYASIISALTLFFIIAFNLTLLDLIFRDIAIFFMAVALAVLSKK